MYVHMYMHANVRRDVIDTDLLRVEAQLAGVFVALGQALVVWQRQLFVQVTALALQLHTARREFLDALHTHKHMTSAHSVSCSCRSRHSRSSCTQRADSSLMLYTQTRDVST